MPQPILIRSILCLALLGAAGAACAAAPASAPAPAPAPAPVVDTIGGRAVESLTMRHPAAKEVIVFEGGSRNTIDKWGTVPEQLSRDATVFVYHRPGYGNSAEAATPRDGRTIVEELRATLRHKGLRPPYVLVGHSLGGLYTQLFARAYPQEVKGLVLVDSLYPRMVKRVEDFPWWSRLAGQLGFSRSVWREIEKIDETGDMVLGLGEIDDMPIVSLVNRPTSATAIAVDFGAFRMDEQTRKQVRALYPNAKRIVADSSHQMALTSPEIVTAAVKQVIAAEGKGEMVAR